MLSSIRPPVDLGAMKYNMVWDGIFHAFTWVMVALGVWRLWRAGAHASIPRATTAFVGALAGGWGLFNFVEGIVDHEILGIHHVHPGRDELAWDMTFLVVGALLIALGVVLVRASWRAPFAMTSTTSERPTTRLGGPS